jgi:predicted component of type VI protein secretion system
MKKNVSQSPAIDFEALLNDVEPVALPLVVKVVEVVEMPIPLSNYDFAKAYQLNLETITDFSPEQIKVKVARRVKRLKSSVIETVFGVETLEEQLSKCKLNSK